MPGTLSGAVAAENKGEIILEMNVLFDINPYRTNVENRVSS
jgi:hypothetical protein